VLGASSENLGDLTFESEGVESPACGIQICVTRRPSGNEHDGVDDGWQGGDTGVLDGDDEWGSRRGTAGVEESGVVVGDQYTDDEDTEDVKDHQSEKDSLDCLWDGLSGVLSLSDSGGNDFGSEEGEGGLNETCEPGKELTGRAGNEAITTLNRDVVERTYRISDLAKHETWLTLTRVPPVSESNGVMIRSTSSHENDTENDKTDNGDNLQAREPELHFSKDSRSQEVYGKDENQKDCHVDCRMRRCVCFRQQISRLRCNKD
jgi:hypothetical protein